MILDSNLSVVLRLIQKATNEYPDWDLGKKALQKSLYFYNLRNNRFSYRWADFGPMCGEIQQIVCDLEAFQRIGITKTETGKPNALTHRMKYIEKQPTLEPPKGTDDELDAVLKFAAKYDARKLELLASVHFWADQGGYGDMVNSIYTILSELKPEANFAEKDVEWAMQTLKENGFLSG